MKAMEAKIKIFSPKEYLDTIRPYLSLSDTINDHKAPMKLRVYSGNEVVDYEIQFGEWKIQLTMQINFISSKDFEEACTKHTKSDKIEITMGSETDDFIKELFESVLQRYQQGLEEKWKGASLFAIVLIYCIIVIIKQAWEEANHT